VNIKVILAGALLAGTATVHAFEYRSDSGDSDNAIGWGNGGNFAWMQQFTVNGADSMITSIQLAFGLTLTGFSSGVAAGTPFNVYVWRGTPTGAGVDAPTLLATASSTVNGGSIDTDVFQSVAINATVTGTTNFFIGASMNTAASVFPAAMQETGTGSYPILNKSWIAGSATAGGFDPNNLTGGLGLSNMNTLGFPSNFLIRAQASPVPEPATMATLAAAMGALALRRRKRSK
jgi:hypothetical protein